MIKALGLTLRARPHFVLSGDIHHYRREPDGPTLHVTAGGGGAFLHPAPLHRREGRVPEVEWPDQRQSRALLWHVPHKIALGRSGFLPHFVLVALYAPLVAYAQQVVHEPLLASLLLLPWLLVSLAYALIGGIRKGGGGTVLLAALLAVPTTLTPMAVAWVGGGVADLPNVPLALQAAILTVLSAGIGSLWFGIYLALLTLFGLENTQAFTALDHPGYKHFVRFRVRADGTAVDAWVVGAVDPLGKNGEPILVDRFTWKTR
jgi:hypothetical protein